MYDICDTCAFEDACPIAHFNPTGDNTCYDYKTMLKGGTLRQTISQAIEAWNLRAGEEDKYEAD